MWSSLIQNRNYNLYFTNNNIYFFFSPFPAEMLFDWTKSRFVTTLSPSIHWLDSGASCRVTICRFVSECVRSVRRAVHPARRRRSLSREHYLPTPLETTKSIGHLNFPKQTWLKPESIETMHAFYAIDAFFTFSIYLYQFDLQTKIMIVNYQNNIDNKVGHKLGHTTLVSSTGCFGVNAHTQCTHWIGFVIGNKAERDLVCNR